MTKQPEWLLDKSAYARLADSADAKLWAERITRGLVQVTTPTLLEIGYSARSSEDWSRSLQAPPAAQMPVATMTPAIERRAVEVQGLLADRGKHRAPSVPDLLIAAAAELSGLTVLHVDKAFELIADITRQPVERLRTQ